MVALYRAISAIYGKQKPFNFLVSWLVTLFLTVLWFVQVGNLLYCFVVLKSLVKTRNKLKNSTRDWVMKSFWLMVAEEILFDNLTHYIFPSLCQSLCSLLYCKSNDSLSRSVYSFFNFSFHFFCRKTSTNWVSYSVPTIQLKRIHSRI